MTVSTAGAVVQDIRFTNGAKLNINAPNVIVRRSEFQGGQIDTDQPGVQIEDVTLNRAAPESSGSEGAVSYCGYTATRVKILNRTEGFRVGCNRTTVIKDSYVRIDPPATCGDWHGDGLQGYNGYELDVSDTTIDFNETMPNGSICGGTSPFFYVGGGGGNPNGTAHVNGLLLKGGGYPFRMGVPGSVQGLKIVNNSWRYAPTSITDSGCGVISPWEAQVVEVDGNWRVTKTVRSLSCTNG
jgi:hypothetical protein